MLARVRTLTPHRRTLLALGTAIGTVAVAGPAAAEHGGAPAIPLNTEQETTGSDTGASGFFSYTIQGSQLCYTLRSAACRSPPSPHTSTRRRDTSPAPIVIHLPRRAVGDDRRGVRVYVTPAAALLAASRRTRRRTTSTSTRRRSPAERSAAR